jgi:hypothetical protein
MLPYMHTKRLGTISCSQTQVTEFFVLVFVELSSFSKSPQRLVVRFGIILCVTCVQNALERIHVPNTSYGIYALVSVELSSFAKSPQRLVVGFEVL